ncbi:MAG: DEAD/DEAH box helicase family protein, partial [Actinomycetes bacterium]
MAEAAGPVPTGKEIERAEAFTLEKFVYPGEEVDVALAPGSPRARALGYALAELDAGAKLPSTKWRRSWSLLLGLERVLSEEEPHLADGTVLNPHQVDALSGTLTALLAARMKVDDLEIAEPVFDVDDAPVEVVAADDEELAAELAALDEEHEEDEDDEGDEVIEEVEVEVDLIEAPEGTDEDIDAEALDDPNADKRFWFEHATGAGKTVAAMGFVDASRTGGILILTHRRNLVDQFNEEIRTRGYSDRISGPLLGEEGIDLSGPVTVETYQWFVRHAGNISSAYTIVICDEAHTALGEKTSAAIREWTGPVFIGMTATGALIARHVTDLFPTQTSRFDLAQAARRGVISPLRCLRIP